jgi:hypothetical protein
MAAASAVRRAAAAALCWPAQEVPVCFCAELQKHLDLYLPIYHHHLEDLPHHSLLLLLLLLVPLLLLCCGLQVAHFLQVDLLLLCWGLAVLPATAGQQIQQQQEEQVFSTNVH